MSLVKSALLLILSASVVDINCHGHFPQGLTCGMLPKLVMPNNEDLSICGPMPYEYSLTGLFDCATQLYTGPKRGSTGHRGSSPLIQGGRVNVYQYTVGSDNKTIQSTICSTGVKSIWHLSAVALNQHGCYYCIYSCDGIALRDFGCVSNNDKFLPEQKKAVAVAQTVPNGHKIHRAQKNCINHGCIGFN